MTIQTEVAKAAKLLDKETPGWYKKVKRSKLAIVSNQDCVLGQVYGDSSFAPESLRSEWCFCMAVPPPEIGRDRKFSWRAVETAWKKEISKRRD